MRTTEKKTSRGAACFQLTQNKSIAEKYLDSPEEYVYEYKITVNGKERMIVTYKKNKHGAALRYYHRLIDLYLRQVYSSHTSSFAYKEDLNILSCLKQHDANDVFLKADIHSFFDTVEPTRLNEIIKTFNKVKRDLTVEMRENLLSSCFYQGRMPIGFVTSPILSDIYLGQLDAFFEEQKDILYTRYADDIIISATGEMAEERLKKAKRDLNAQLEILGLSLNKRKTYIRRLREPGDAIHLLGLNIVKSAGERNYITVSDAYVRETCKEYCHYLEEKEKMDPEKRDVVFAKVYGKIRFIAFASESSARKLMKMLKVKTGIDTYLSIENLK